MVSNNSNNTKTFENSITLVRVTDGESASSYSVDTNYNEILKFVNLGDEGEKIDFSPPSLKFEVFDFLEGEKLSDFYWNISYLKDGEFETVSERDQEDQIEYPDYFVYESLSQASLINEEDSDASSGIDGTSLTFRLKAFYEFYKNSTSEKERLFIQAINENAPLKFVCFDKTNRKILATKIITIQNGVSADMAKLNIGAAGIVASIRDAGLRFDANGLTVQNGNFVIEREYIRVEPQPSSESEFSQAEYYYKTDDGSREGYTKATDYEVGVIYYIKTDETNKKVLYADDEGNLTIVGNVYADNGYFSGEVHATSGTFEGRISSREGSIGGFKIDDVSISSINDTIKLISKTTTNDAGESVDESEILAGKITIKEGYLTDRIVIQADTSNEHGRVVLSNPETNEGKVLESGTLVLKNNGYLQLGNIEMYGGGRENLDGYIRSTFTDEAGLKQNGFWQINENGTAHFDQIYANNARIKNSVLEINTIQTVGSLMLFKDSWPVVKIETYEAQQEDYPGSTLSQSSNFLASMIYVEGRPEFVQGDYLYANDHYYLVDRAIDIEYYEETENVDENEQITYSYTLTNDRIFQSNKKYFMKEDQDYYVPVEYSNFITMIQLRSLIDENDTIVTKIGKIKNQEIAIFAKEFKTGVQYYCFNKVSTSGQNISSFYEQFSSSFVNSYDSSFVEGKDYYQKEKLEINTADDFKTHYNEGKGNIYTISTTVEGGQMLSILGESRKESGTGIQDFAVGNSLTISEISDLGGRLGFVKHLILGDLTETGIDILAGMGGWGLYCDNVYLNGALVTRDVETYAGINTKSGIQFSKNKEGQEQQDRSNIVFWGGADGIDEASIQNAKFQVTAGGTLYAQDAIIENSIFSGADIYSARLFTAEIHGNNGSLSIYDSSKGVVFRKEVDGDASEIYTLKDGGFFFNGNAFVTIPNTIEGRVEFNGDFLSSDNSKQVGLKNGFIAFSHGTDGAGVAKIEFQNLEQNLNVSALQFTIGDGFNGKPQLELRAEKMTIESEASFENNVWLTNKMQYRKVSDGYDLYVYE